MYYRGHNSSIPAAEAESKHLLPVVVRTHKKPESSGGDNVLAVIFVTFANFVSYSAWTLANKVQFSRHGLDFTILLTAYQMLFVGFVCWAYLLCKAPVRSETPKLVAPNKILLLGVVRAADIGFGNAALLLITVALQQILKSTIPVYVCALNATVLRRPVSRRVWTALIPIIGGAALASWGDLSSDNGKGAAVWSGVAMASVSCLARAGKATINESLLRATKTGDRTNPLQIISMESPVSGCILALLGTAFERKLVARWYYSDAGSSLGHLLFYNSCCGALMLLNQWSYVTIIRQTSSVTCQVLMNLKMITLVAVSAVFFNTPVGGVRVVGIAVAAGGCTCYALVRQWERDGRAGKGEQK